MLVSFFMFLLLADLFYIILKCWFSEDFQGDGIGWFLRGMKDLFLYIVICTKF